MTTEGCEGIHELDYHRCHLDCRAVNYSHLAEEVARLVSSPRIPTRNRPLTQILPQILVELLFGDAEFGSDPIRLELAGVNETANARRTLFQCHGDFVDGVAAW